MPANPLATKHQPAPKPDHPMMMHARLAQFAHSLAPDDLASKAGLVGYVTPILGALAGNPKVTSKDVVKAAAQAVADGKVSATDAVKFLSGVPSSPDDLRPWLKNLYMTNMTALVHMKAAMMPGAAPQAAPQAAPGPAVPQQPMPGAMP